MIATCTATPVNDSDASFRAWGGGLSGAITSAGLVRERKPNGFRPWREVTFQPDYTNGSSLVWQDLDLYLATT